MSPWVPHLQRPLGKSKVTKNELRLETGVRKSLAIKKGINLSSEKEVEGITNFNSLEEKLVSL